MTAPPNPCHLAAGVHQPARDPAHAEQASEPRRRCAWSVRRQAPAPVRRRLPPGGTRSGCGPHGPRPHAGQIRGACPTASTPAWHRGAIGRRRRRAPQAIPLLTTAIARPATTTATARPARPLVTGWSRKSSGKGSSNTGSSLQRRGRVVLGFLLTTIYRAGPGACTPRSAAIRGWLRRLWWCST